VDGGSSQWTVGGAISEEALSDGLLKGLPMGCLLRLKVIAPPDLSPLGGGLVTLSVKCIPMLIGVVRFPGQ
jgi:hypothetical protein